jgi:two-component system, OmpR family, phosphate regulon response regulator PhoB
MGHSILIVHGDTHVREAARVVLELAGHAVREAKELSLDRVDRADLLLVGWTALSPVADTLQRLRSHDSTRGTRIIVLAPRDEMRAAISTLEFGADDCVALPFEGEELLVRINACLRRPAASGSNERLRAGPVVLDRDLHRILVYDEEVELAPTEFRLMAFFLENQGRVFNRDELLTRAWGKHVKAGHRTVDVHVRRLRQQLERFGCESLIQTVRGFGYRLCADTARRDLRTVGSPLGRSRLS